MDMGATREWWHFGCVGTGRLLVVQLSNHAVHLGFHL